MLLLLLQEVHTEMKAEAASFQKKIVLKDLKAVVIV